MEKLSILIAEDEPLTRMDLKEMLEGAGYDVCGEANNGQKAIELAQQLMPDLAILDIKMPDLDGLDTAKALHSMNIPVIILTAYSQQNLINRAEKVNVYSYLIKPVTERELLPAVQLAYARWKEMQTVQKKLKHTEDKLKFQKIIAHARSILAAQNGISDYEAHQQLIKEAMNLRISLGERAVQIIRAAKKDHSS